MAQSAVVHIDGPRPKNVVDIYPQLVAVMKVRIDHRRQQVVSRGYRMDVAIEVKIDRFARYDLRLPASCRPSFQSEHGSKRWLTKRDTGAFSKPINGLGKTYGDDCFSFALASGGHRGHQDEFAASLR